MIGLALIEDAVQQRALLYDKGGDAHYDTISAFIKSVRGSDPDAAVYWLARMLESGEDLMFIARRLVILAGEDVGLADPHALPVAVAAQQAAHFVGMPEAMFPLAEATLYLATAPKSNSVGRAYGAAMEAVRETRNDPVPLHLRNAVDRPDARPGLRPRLPLQPRLCRGRSASAGASATCPKTSPDGAFTTPGDQGFEAGEIAAQWRTSARSAPLRTPPRQAPPRSNAPPLYSAVRDAGAARNARHVRGIPRRSSARQEANLPRPRVRKQCAAAEVAIDATRYEVRESRRCAPIGYVRHLHVGHLKEQHLGQVRRTASAWRCHRELPGRESYIVDEFFKGMRR